MRNFSLSLLIQGAILFAPVAVQANNDQVMVVFGSSGYILYKVIDFANDHGFRYIKILSYEFDAFDHAVSGKCKGEPPRGGRYFELKDGSSSVSFICFKNPPNDPHIIDIEKYQSLLDAVSPPEND